MKTSKPTSQFTANDRSENRNGIKRKMGALPPGRQTAGWKVRWSGADHGKGGRRASPRGRRRWKKREGPVDEVSISYNVSGVVFVRKKERTYN